MKTFMVYFTAGNLQEAHRISHALVEERLAACVNILGPIRSIYRWQGKRVTAREVALLAKTTEGRLNKLIRKVRDLHSYEVPCIVAWAMARGYPPFLEWIADETRAVVKERRAQRPGLLHPS